MADVNGASSAGVPDAHLARLLNKVNRRLRAEATPPESFPPLSVAQTRILDTIPSAGCRIVDLSGELRVSSQGLGQLITSLARDDYVELSADPSDRRAKLVRRTVRGDEVVRAVHDLLAEVDERWRLEIGPDRYQVFREVLTELAEG
jgi:DNA-binding MarR family transcriptional regulator